MYIKGGEVIAGLYGTLGYSQVGRADWYVRHFLQQLSTGLGRFHEAKEAWSLKVVVLGAGRSV
jgi:hypothetical protein